MVSWSSFGTSWVKVNLIRAVVLSSAAHGATSSSNSSLVVHLPSFGSFAGTKLSTTISGYPLAAPVDVWYGIEYAEQPTGDLRFSPVQRPSAFNGTRNAKAYGKFCIQEPGNSNLVTYIKTGLTYGEDCLNLNVYRPSGVSPDKKLPVLVWIHGGLFRNGAGIIFDGASFVAASTKPLIVVTLNYRLAALGFLASLVFSKLGIDNIGLQDQHQLLRFVHKYVSSFGGDPERITLGGKSAGAHSVGFHYQNHFAPGEELFHLQYSNQFEQFVERVGCQINETAETQLVCLRAVDAELIEKTATRLLADYRYNDTHPFQPGSMYVPTNLTADDEAWAWFSNLYTGLDQSDRHFFNRLYPDPQTNSVSPYVSSRGQSAQFTRLSDAYGDTTYISVAQDLASRLSEEGLPVWKMHWNTNNSITPYLGISHDADVLYAWAEPDTQYPEAGTVLAGYYASFVVSGDPNAYKASNALEWNRYDHPGSDGLVWQVKVDASGTRIERDDIRRDALEYWRAIPKKLDH
ncbi:acetylcholinesterase [Colletotrichum somersetense]|nr:acetylcholinesterase [Colletotrichum somersetense]